MLRVKSNVVGKRGMNAFSTGERNEYPQGVHSSYRREGGKLWGAAVTGRVIREAIKANEK